MKFSEIVVLKGKRRKCNQCGSAWFVDTYLEAKSRIQGAVGDFASVASSGVTRMAAMSAANSAQKGLQENCPSCSSRDYVESAVLYTPAKPPRIPEPVGPCPLCRKPVSIEAAKCPNCTGDISKSESDKLKAAFAAGEKEFSATQELLQERLKVQKGLRRRTNATIWLGMFGLVAGSVAVLSMIEYFDPSFVVPIAIAIPVAYLIAIITASVLEKKGLVRFAMEQDKGK